MRDPRTTPKVSEQALPHNPKPQIRTLFGPYPTEPLFADSRGAAARWQSHQIWEFERRKTKAPWSAFESERESGGAPKVMNYSTPSRLRFWSPSWSRLGASGHWRTGNVRGPSRAGFHSPDWRGRQPDVRDHAFRFLLRSRGAEGAFAAIGRRMEWCCSFPVPFSLGLSVYVRPRGPHSQWAIPSSSWFLLASLWFLRTIGTHSSRQTYFCFKRLRRS